MPDTTRLPALLRLVDDESRTVRVAVLEALAAFGTTLEAALRDLESPPDEPSLQAVLDQVARFTERGDDGPYFEVGQVVRHKRFGYRGLIVACDPTCRDPDAHPSALAGGQPWYRLLVHNCDRVTYVSQAGLETDGSGEGVRHPLVSRYFRGFQDGLYLRGDQAWDEPA